jgi:hypothetical protein
MTEQQPDSPVRESVESSESAEPFEEPTDLSTGEPTRTGVPAVDRVLREVDDLDRVPLEEHLGRFEHAHETLRTALDADPDEPGDPA